MATLLLKCVITEHMQFISPFYDENSWKSMDLKYKNLYWEMKDKQYNFLFILAMSPILPQRQGYYPHSVGVSLGATLLIVAQFERQIDGNCSNDN